MTDDELNALDDYGEDVRAVVHEYKTLVSEHKALLVERDFWRRATELALRAMSDAEDKLESLLEHVRILLKSEPQDVDSEAWRQLEIRLEQLAPPADDAPPENVG